MTNFFNALNRVTLCYLKRNQKYYRKAKEFVATFQFDCSKFINILIIFISKKRKTIDNELITVENEQYKQKINSN